MKRLIVFIIAGLLIFSSSSFVSADEVSDLKAKIEALETAVNSLKSQLGNLEAKQNVQTDNVKKISGLEESIQKLKESQVGTLGEGLTIGGHLKFALYDRTQGKHNGTDQHTNGSAGFIGPDSPLYLMVGKELSDVLRLDVRTMYEVAARATPSLGSDISRTTSTTIATTVDTAYMTALLPQGYELKVGQMRVMFSEDYAKETWWHELYNLNKGTCTIQSWHDFGAELYKNIDFDKWSLPVYFYLLNGSSVDNNENKTVLLHIAPEFFQTKLRLLGSFGYGKWDDKGKEDMLRTAYGFDWNYQKFNLRGEYIYSLYKDKQVPLTALTPTADGKNEGYWVKAIYTFNPKWKAVVEQSYVDLYKAGLTTGQKSMISDEYSSTSLALDYSVTPSSTIITQYENVNAHRSDDSDKLDYGRITMGWRTTF